MTPKNAGLAAILSFFISGLGQIYNGQIGKGLIIIVVQVVNALLISVFIGIITGGAVWIWAMYDAYQTAQAINRDYSLGASKIGSGGGSL